MGKRSDRPEERFKSALIDQAFVDRRWKQRRALRRLPDWLVKHATAVHDNPDGTPRETPSHGPINRPDRDVMESDLRDMADEIIEGLDRATLDALAEAVQVAAQQTLYGSWHWTDAPALDARKAEAEERAAELPLQAGPDVDKTNLRNLVVALTWADELAGDYKDPRLTE